MKNRRLAIRIGFLFGLAVMMRCGQDPFSEPPDSTERFKVYTSDYKNGSDRGMIDALASLVSSATFSVDCAFGRLNDSRVISAILERYRAGKRLRIAFDADQKTSDPGSLQLQAAGLTSGNQLAYGNSGEGGVRHNFCLIDERVVWVGSDGIDASRLGSRPNVALIMGSDEFGIGREFKKEITLLKEGLFGASKGKLDFATKYVLFDQVVEVRWGPQEDPMIYLGNEISDIATSLRFYSTSFQKTSTNATKNLPDVINNRYNAGTKVQGVFDTGALFEADSRTTDLLAGITQKQYFNSLSGPSLQLFILDRGTPHQRVILYFGSLRTKADSSDDSMVLMLKGASITEELGNWYDGIAANSATISTTPTNATAANNHEVMISEIQWMGSYSDGSTSISSDEFVELHNPGTTVVNISNWKFACSNGTTVNSSLTIPAGAQIAAGGYFVIANNRDNAITGAHFTTTSLSMSNSSNSCILTDGDATVNGAPYASVAGTIVDTAGTGVAGTGDFDANYNKHSSRTGYNASSSMLSDYNGSGRRSMERINIGTNNDGTLASNWQSNILPPGQNTLIGSGYQKYTFASPGAAALLPQNSTAGSVIINEVLVKGSLDDAGTAKAFDEFVELKNTTSSTINLSYWKLTNAGSGGDLILPLGGNLPGSGFYTVADNRDSAFSAADAGISDMTLPNTGTSQIQLQTAAATVIDTIFDGVKDPVSFGGIYSAAACTQSGCKLARSMERNDTPGNGTLASNWHMNSYDATTNTGVASGYRTYTFASPGVANSAHASRQFTSREVIISEVGWAGTKEDNDTTHTNDEYLELYNPGDSAIDLSFVVVTGLASSTDSGNYLIPSGTSIAAKSYLTISTQAAAAFGITQTSLVFGDTVINNGAAGETIELKDNYGFTIDALPNGSWPGDNGAGSVPKKSMERKEPIADGTVAANWSTAISAGSNIATGYKTKTFGTPGAINSINSAAISLNRGLFFATSSSHPNGVGIITVTHTAADTNAASTQTVNVSVTSSTDGTGFNLVLTETGNNTGIFTSQATGTNLNFTTGASASPQLRVSSGDTVTVSYNDGSSTITATGKWYSQNLVINEIGSNNNAATANDYLEVYNPNTTAVDLSGLYLWRDSDCLFSSGWDSQIPLSGSLAAGGFHLAGDDNWAGGTVTPDNVTTNLVINGNDCVALTANATSNTTATADNMIDFVGFGTSPVFEGAVATDMAGNNNQCISRYGNGTDTNNNQNDFANETLSACTPKASNTAVPFNVTQASSTASTTITVTFNRAPNSTSSQNKDNYCIAFTADGNCNTPDLTVSAASLAGSVVTLTTAAQTGGTAYTVYVSNVTAAGGGTALGTSSAAFCGFGGTPLVIAEIGVPTAANAYVILYNKTGCALNLTGYYLWRDSACTINTGAWTENLPLPSFSMPSHSYYLVGRPANTLSPASDTTAWAASGGTIGSSNYCLALTNSSTAPTASNSANVVDMVAFGTTTDQGEGGANAPNPGSTSIKRSGACNDGDTNANNTDFSTGATNIRNSASAVCP